MPIVVALTLLVAPGAGRAATAHDTWAVQDYIGDFTPDKTSDSLFVGHRFVVAATNSSPKDAVTGSNPSLEAQFDDYCNPVIAGSPVDYYILSYTWSPTGAMGGCTSPMTKGHIYVWGSHNDIAYVHPGTRGDGEPFLKGGWAIEDFSGSSPSITYYPITARRPVVNVVTHLKVSQVVRQHSHQYRQTEISSVGEIRLNSRPPQGCSPEDWDATWSDGSLDLEITKVGGPSLIELYDLTLGINKPTTNKFAICEPGGFGYADAIPVIVTKADPSEKDACPKRATGFMSLESHKANAGGDKFSLTIPRCKLDLEFTADDVKKGDHVAVVLDLNRDGY